MYLKIIKWNIRIYVRSIFNDLVNCLQPAYRFFKIRVQYEQQWLWYRLRISSMSMEWKMNEQPINCRI